MTCFSFRMEIQKKRLMGSQQTKTSAIILENPKNLYL
jgi:hypothetical protein